MSQGHFQGLYWLPLQDWVGPSRQVQAARMVPWLASEDRLNHQTLEIKQTRFRKIEKKKRQERDNMQKTVFNETMGTQKYIIVKGIT